MSTVVSYSLHLQGNVSNQPLLLMFWPLMALLCHDLLAACVWAWQGSSLSYTQM